MSEVHFYSPSLDAYWVAIEAPTDATRETYPADTIGTPARPSVHHQWRDGAWTYVAPPPPDPAIARARMSLSRRQLLIGLASRGWITSEEAVAAATTGAMPTAVAAAVASLPAGDQVAARITWASMSVAQRLDPLVELLAIGQGVTPDEVDAFFTAFAQI